MNRRLYDLICCFVALLLLDEFTHVRATNEEGEAWLGQRRKNSKVSELPSGLLYRVKGPGDGQFHPAIDTYCSVDYDITLTDGTPVESTKGGQPSMLRPEDSIPAVREALQLMVDGDWWELYVPSHLGYDARKNKEIREGEALMIQLNLNSVLQGDKIPVGEVHNCFVELDDDEATGHFRVKASEGCDDRDKKYIEKIVEWNQRAAHVREELARLRGMLKESDMKESLSVWVRRRIHILKQFLREDMRICTVGYVESGNNTFVIQQTDCNFKEQEYIEKVQEWELSKINEEIGRLVNYREKSSMEEELASWVTRRVRILNQIARSRSELVKSEAETAKDEL